MSSGPPTTISCASGRRGGSSGRSRWTGVSVARAAHSSTRSAPPRRSPKRAPPQAAQRAGASHTTQRTEPSSERSIPAQIAHAAGAPHVRQTAAIPYPGRGENTNPRVAARKARTNRGARPSGPGARPPPEAIGDGPEPPPAVVGPRPPMRRRAPIGRTLHPRVRFEPWRHRERGSTGSPILAMRGMGLARDQDQAQVPHRREDRRTCADHHVIGPGLDVEPHAEPGAFRPAHEDRGAVAERVAQGRRGGGQRLGLRDDHQGAATRGETPRDRFDGRILLLVGSGTQHEARRRRPSVTQGRQQPRTAFIRLEHRGDGRRGGHGPRHMEVERRLLGGHARRSDAREDGRERRNVTLAHPPGELQHLVVEEPNRGDGLLHRQRSRREFRCGSQDPATHELAVERHLDERADPGVQLTVEPVGERTVQRQDGPVDADRDRPVQRGGAIRRRRGGRRRGRSPPRGTPCARNGRRRPSRCRWGAGGPGRG